MNMQRLITAAAERPDRAVTFQAWQVRDDGQKRTKGFGVKLPIEGKRYPSGKYEPACGAPIEVSAAETLREAIDLAKTRCWHMDHLLILETDASRATQRLHVYAIRQDSNPKYRGHFNTERYHELYEFHLFDLDVVGFVPKEPWKLTRGSTTAEIIGIDPTLVKQR
jgi:hypothetical protein